MSRLDSIVDAATRRVEERRAQVPTSELERRAKDAPPVRSFYEALSACRFSVIAEHKRRSPSAGIMNARNVERCLDVYRETEWISAVSVLTDQDHFDGSLDDLVRARRETNKPVLRKDFIFDEYQVWEARAHGADAILLMAVLHADRPARMKRLYDLAHELGMDALIEVVGMTDRPVHELVATVPDKARIWGINARGALGGTRLGGRTLLTRVAAKVLRRDLLTDTRQHAEHRRLIPEGRLSIAESGIATAAQLQAAVDMGYHAALIGTAFVQGPKTPEQVAAELDRVFATLPSSYPSDPSSDQTLSSQA